VTLETTPSDSDLSLNLARRLADGEEADLGAEEKDLDS